jgi:tetratricopeptide (TPR) repeat protein
LAETDSENEEKTVEQPKAESEQNLKRLIEEKERDYKFGKNHPATIDLILRLGVFYVEKQMWSNSLEPLELAFEHYFKTMKSDKPQIPQVLGILAEVYLKLEKEADVEFKFNQYYKKAEADLGERHPLLGEISFNLGAFFRIQSRFDNSKDAFEKSLEIWDKKIRPDHPRIIATYTQLGHVYTFLKDYPTAEKYFRRNIKIRSKVLGDDHLKVGEHWKDIGLFYRQTKNLKKSIDALNKAYTIISKNMKGNNPMIRDVKNTLAQVTKEQDAALGKTESKDLWAHGNRS